jgi:hypothetical protein
MVGTGWFTEDPNEITRRFGGTWKTANFMAGDALVFTYRYLKFHQITSLVDGFFACKRTVHMSTVNTTKYARISCDTRYYQTKLVYGFMNLSISICTLHFGG